METVTLQEIAESFTIINGGLYRKLENGDLRQVSTSPIESVRCKVKRVESNMRLPIRERGKFILRLKIGDYKMSVGSYSEEQDYWTARAKKDLLFGIGTKGLEHIKTLTRYEAKIYVKLAMAN